MTKRPELSGEPWSQDVLIPYLQHIKGFHGPQFPKALVAPKRKKGSWFAHTVEEAAAHLFPH